MQLRDIPFFAPLKSRTKTSQAVLVSFLCAREIAASAAHRLVESQLRGSPLLFAAIAICIPLSLAGCGGRINFTPAASGFLQATPSTVNFGAVPYGQTATSNVSLVNPGSAAVQVTQIAVSGQSFAAGAVNNSPVTVPAGGAYNFNVSFSPAQMGTTTGQVTVSSNGTSDGTVVIGLDGTGAATGAAIAAADLSALSCASGSVIGAGTDSCTVTLSTAAPNGGITINLASNNAAVTTPAAVTVPAGSLTASFTASIGAVATAQSAIITAADGGASDTFTLQLGVAAPTLNVSTTSLAFGSVNVNTPATQAVTLSSAGDVPVTVSSVSANGPGFTVAGSGLPTTLGPGQTTTLYVSYDPLTAGPAAGQLVIQSNSSSGPSTAISLSGSGVPVLSQLMCSSASINGAGADYCTVTLNAAAASGGFTVSLTSNNPAVALPASVTVPAGVAVASFTAAVSFVSTAQSVVLTAGANGVATTFVLQLTGITPTLSINSSSLSFGSVNVNSIATQTVVLSSTGSSALTINSASAYGTGFTVSSSALPVTLAPGHAITLAVQFDPLAAGPAVGQLVIGSNASSGSTTVVNLSGTGQPMLAALMCAIGSLTGGGTDSCTVALNAAAGSGGFAVNLASNSPAATVPAALTVPAGATSANFVATFSSVSTAQTTTLTATANGVAQACAVQLNVNSSGLSINASSVGFGNVPLNTPVTQTVTLAASGALPVAISAAIVTGPGFSISGTTLPVTLTVGQPAAIDVTFDPTTAGAATGQVSIVSTSLTNGAIVINLSGTGVASAYGVNLSWDAPTDSEDPVVGYLVFRSPTGAATYQQLSGVTLNQTTYVDTSVGAGQIYDYIVESVDALGVTSAPSNVATVAIP
jgi:Abnormal spindle-like microcephaly-assoc'd, ASPM-SPD-2-Hydin